MVGERGVRKLAERAEAEVGALSEQHLDIQTEPLTGALAPRAWALVLLILGLVGWSLSSAGKRSCVGE